MRQILAGLLAMSPDAESRPAPKGPSYGFWVGNGDFPDMDIYPRYVFMSCHPDVSSSSADEFMRDLIKFFEGYGLVGFDPQRGKRVTSDTFTFFDEEPITPSWAKKKPWWKFW